MSGNAIGLPMQRKVGHDLSSTHRDTRVMGGCTFEVSPSLMAARRQLLLPEQPCGDQSAHLVQVSCLNVCRLLNGPLSSEKHA